MSEVIRIDGAGGGGPILRFRIDRLVGSGSAGQVVLVLIGAERSGNEILKGLALLGIGNVLVADLDKVENSNLSRSVLFREQDCGLPKAEVAPRQ